MGGPTLAPIWVSVCQVATPLLSAEGPLAQERQTSLGIEKLVSALSHSDLGNLGANSNVARKVALKGAIMSILNFGSEIETWYT